MKNEIYQNLNKTITEIEESLKCETDGGVVHVEWDDKSPMTPIGQFVFFAHFLKSCNLFQDWVENCPIWKHIDQKTAKDQALRNLLGTYLLAVLAGNKRYAHVTAMRNDKVSAHLLGMTKIYSEDTVRRAFRTENVSEQEEITRWQQKSLDYCYRPLLAEEWILDVDVTIKALYGNQEGAEIGYNPHKPGRPSHTLHTYMMAESRLILDCEVQSGIQSPSNYTMPRLVEMLSSWTLKERPSCIRGDCAFGNEKVLSEIESQGIPYLFKIKQTKKIKDLINLISQRDEKWADAGKGWEGVCSSIQLSTWNKKRTVIILRRKLDDKGKRSRKRKIQEDPKQLHLPNFRWMSDLPNYEYAVLVTTLTEDMLEQIYKISANSKKSKDRTLQVACSEISPDQTTLSDGKEPELKTQKNEKGDLALNIPACATPVKMKNHASFILACAQLYRDRATCENNFDELKNQWGWGGFVTQDLFRSQVSARIVAQIYNWWSLFTFFIDDSKHREGITSRPLMLHGVGRMTSHGGQIQLKITSLHAKQSKIRESIALIQHFLRSIKHYARNGLSKLEKWVLILSAIFKDFLKGRALQVPMEV
jgi:hypothetical protein